jgi:N utilization substance protein B
MDSRHRARRLALQGLCCLDVQGQRVRDLVEAFLADSREPAAAVAMARSMLSETCQQSEALDAILKRHTRDWDLQRLAMVDRSILRLAVGELFAGAVPPKVVIVEAIRLAREFSTAESPRFINGVLDAVAKELADEMAAPARDDDPHANETP